MTPLEKFLAETRIKRRTFGDTHFPYTSIESTFMENHERMEKIIEETVPVLELMADDHGDKLGPCKCFIHIALETVNKIAVQK